MVTNIPRPCSTVSHIGRPWDNFQKIFPTPTTWSDLFKNPVFNQISSETIFSPILWSIQKVVILKDRLTKALIPFILFLFNILFGSKKIRKSIHFRILTYQSHLATLPFIVSLSTLQKYRFQFLPYLTSFLCFPSQCRFILIYLFVSYLFIIFTNIQIFVYFCICCIFIYIYNICCIFLKQKFLNNKIPVLTNILVSVKCSN